VDEQQVEATIDTTELGRGSYNDWRLHRDYCIKFPQSPTLGTSYKCGIGSSDARLSGSGEIEDGVSLDVPSFVSLYFFTSLDLGPVQMPSALRYTTLGDRPSAGGTSPCT